MRTTAALAFALTLVAAHAAAQTADEIIDKHLAAIGGRDALAKLTSRTASGTISLMTPAGEVSGSISLFAKPPNKARSVIKIDLSQFGAGELTLDQRFDGAAGYILDSMNGNRDVTGNQLDNMANSGFPTPFLKYKENGVKVELVGKEKLGDRDVFVLQVTPKQGSVSKQYFDAETYLLLKTVATVNVPQLGQDVEQIVELSDYRPVDGLKVAFALKATNPAQSYSIALGTVRHDVEIDEQMFKKP